jgi:hypothetical protein
MAVQDSAGHFTHPPVRLPLMASVSSRDGAYIESEVSRAVHCILLPSAVGYIDGCKWATPSQVLSSRCQSYCPTCVDTEWHRWRVPSHRRDCAVQCSAVGQSSHCYHCRLRRASHTAPPVSTLSGTGGGCRVIGGTVQCSAAQWNRVVTVITAGSGTHTHSSTSAVGRIQQYKCSV